jgi:selenocysteine lyase/cysteine desulfurase
MDAQKGGVRFSMAHFNNADDVSATIAALDELL